MVITDKLVYVHQPKTGGTFVTDVLFRLHDYRWTHFQHLKLAAFNEVRGGKRHGTITLLDKHGTCSDVPAKHREKTTLATIRNPFDHYVSQYKFEWWQRRDFRKYYRDVPNLEERFPTFPDLSFDNFIDLMEASFCQVRDEDDSPRFGWATEEFARYYFRNGREALAALSESEIESGRYQADMFDVRFIHQEHLNDELHDFLVSMGYPSGEVEFVKTSERVMPKGHRRPRDDTWQSYYTPELLARLRRSDRLIFHAFPEYDV